MLKQTFIEATMLPDFPGYSVTPNGKIVSFKFKSPRALKPYVCSSGYLMVGLSKENKVHKKLVHRIVAEIFLPNPENLPEVNHKDGNKINADVSNLEWSTRIGNEIHAYKTGLKKTGRSTVFGVTWSASRKKWVVRRMVDGARKFYGYYNSQLEAETTARRL